MMRFPILLALLVTGSQGSARGEEAGVRTMQGLTVTATAWDVPGGGPYDDAAVAQTGAAVYSRDGGLHYRIPGSTAVLPAQLILPQGASQLLLEADALYAYGDGAYRLAEDARFESVLKTPAPITALAASPGRLLFALGGSIYQRPQSGAIRLLYQSSLAPLIDSLAYDALTGVVFFSTRLGVYALRAGTADIILEGVSGQLRLDGETLILESMKDKKQYLIEGWREVLTR